VAELLERIVAEATATLDRLGVGRPAAGPADG